MARTERTIRYNHGDGSGGNGNSGDDETVDLAKLVGGDTKLTPDDEIPDFLRDEVKEDSEVFEYLNILYTQDFPAVMNFLDTKNPDKFTKEDHEELKAITKKIATSLEFVVQAVEVVRRDRVSPLGRVARHDFGASETVLLLRLDNFKYLLNREFETIKDVAKIFSELGKLMQEICFISGILEDIYLKRTSLEHIPKEHIRSFDPRIIGMAMQHLEDSPDSGIRAKIKLEINIEDLVLQPGEQFMGSPGLLINSLQNFANNANKDSVGASVIRVSLGRIDNRIVMRVGNNGKVMPDAYLERGSAFIFSPGVSHSGGLGVGLANVDKRLESVGSDITVVSGETAFFSTGKNKLVGPDSLGGNREKTEFEISAPIILAAA